jgi:hypothetical protein
MKIAACLTSKSMHYCSPPKIITRMRSLLVPPGAGRTLIDPWTNDASQVGADLIADGIRVSGHDIRWTDADCSYENPPYGSEIEDCIETSHHWHVEVGMPGVILLPARTDTRWMQGGTKKSGNSVKIVPGIHRSCDAWVEVKGRLTFWRPIPITRKVAAESADPDYYLQKWWPWASKKKKLPAPFRLVGPGLAVGPEVSGKPGKPAIPQAAPFPSLVGFWADRVGRYGLRDEGAEHPIDVKEFARYFASLGTLYVRTGDRRGVYPRGAA